MGKGQPKITFFIKFCIAYKVKQYQKRWNLSPFKAWMKFTNHDSFKDLMAEHFKNKSYANFWVDNIYKNLDVRKTFYKNHIAKIMKELGHIKIYSPKEYKAYQRQIKARKLSGIGSLKRSVKRVRKA
jgi:hypothetical protein|tara:strand:+ start:836 stop:1216 length:381 start_codon:yes stop_codon:yes gene_type:complete